jgi:hypothetical protein
MKLAILISGQPRNFKLSYEKLQEAFLNKYDCDVYFHTWKTTNFESTNFGGGNFKYRLEEESFNQLLELYKPKSWLIEPPTTFDASGYCCPIWRQPLNNTLSMYYSIYKTYQLIDQEYDYVIRSRFDIDYSQFDLTLPTSGINIPKWNTDPRVQHRGYYDVFAIGDSPSMKVYSEVFCNLFSYVANDENYLKFLQGGWPGQDSPLRNEYLLKWHLVKNNIEVKELATLQNKSDIGLIR